MVSCHFENPPVSKELHSGYKSRSTLKSNFPAESRIYVFLKKKVLTNSVGDDKIICVAKRQQNALVAQLDRVSDYESEGQGFESLRARHNRNIKKICSAKTPILSGFFAAQTPGFGDAYS